MKTKGQGLNTMTSMHNSDKNKVMKVLLLGDSYVGKTSLLNMYANNSFSEKYKATIGMDFLTKVIKTSKGEVTVQIWDSAGQERFSSLGNAFYRGTEAVMLIFDVTKESSFKSLASWKEQFLLRSNVDSKDDLPFLVIGNKIDLDGRRVITFEQANNWCTQNDYPYIETSAKTGEGVVKAFEEIAEKYRVQEIDYDKNNLALNENEVNFKTEEEEEDENDNKLNLNEKNVNRKKDDSCCGN
eukprot:TRINITY_DN4439_c0_g1_i1.p1 TRINITY_DN4439_c0_g1~~TRINITY_DN4439_c0_g1_i1.p1  ORF type:complete len:241 (-),score=58.50 TRINITY_DN4439_c0_g1_i1:18-740(-)